MATTAVATEPATAATATETIVRRCTTEPWRRGRSHKWYGVRRGKDGPSAIYDAWYGTNGAAEATAGASGARYRAFAADALGETGAERWAAAFAAAATDDESPSIDKPHELQGDNVITVNNERFRTPEVPL